jgi:hypothetical protein
MDASGDFEDLFSDGATPAFGGSDPLDSFWAELEANDLPQPSPQHNHGSGSPEMLQQHTVEGEEEEDEQGQDHHLRLLIQHEWDGTTEPSPYTLRYTVEWKAVMNTKRIVRHEH